MLDKITLGDREFAIAPFTFDQLRVQIGHFRAAEQPLGDGGFEAARAIIAGALEGQIAEADLAALRVSLTQVIAAVRRIGLISGLYLAEERDRPGEPSAS